MEAGRGRRYGLNWWEGGGGVGGSMERKVRIAERLLMIPVPAPDYYAGARRRHQQSWSSG